MDASSATQRGSPVRRCLPRECVFSASGEGRTQRGQRLENEVGSPVRRDHREFPAVPMPPRLSLPRGPLKKRLRTIFIPPITNDCRNRASGRDAASRKIDDPHSAARPAPGRSRGRHAHAGGRRSGSLSPCRQLRALRQADQGRTVRYSEGAFPGQGRRIGRTVPGGRRRARFFGQRSGACRVEAARF